jgi:hypothetical protein
MNRLGALLCILYASIIALCVGAAFSADTKGHYVLLQLPIAFQMAGLDALGMASKFNGMSWVTSYAILALPTFLFLYFLGWGISRLARR